MIIQVANPIYDSVFKYLMEDERISRTILSALLKKDVVAVTMRPHEYSNTLAPRGGISMFRIDFAAEVREEDGQVHMVLIELQKTWLPTETLRFRQYIGAQYSLPQNVHEEDGVKPYAYPMYAVYLLGHCVGDIKEPVFYVHHGVKDYDGRDVTEGVPDRFVESLTHDSIFVQIPLLHGRVNNRLEKVLSLFDQTAVNKLDAHVIDVEESAYADDIEMEYVVQRLCRAAASPAMRQDMTVEDEFFKAVEDLDTGIMLRDKKLAEQEKEISEKEAQISEKEAQIKKLVQNLWAKGMAAEEIAAMMSIDSVEIEKLLKP